MLARIPFRLVQAKIVTAGLLQTYVDTGGLQQFIGEAGPLQRSAATQARIGWKIGTLALPTTCRRIRFLKKDAILTNLHEF